MADGKARARRSGSVLAEGWARNDIYQASSGPPVPHLPPPPARQYMPEN